MSIHVVGTKRVNPAQHPENFIASSVLELVTYSASIFGTPKISISNLLSNSREIYGFPGIKRGNISTVVGN